MPATWPASPAKRKFSRRSTNIAAIYGLEESDGVPALVMELVEGPTLAERIARGPLPLEETLSVARRIAEALEAAHEMGVVQRDLKPANVKITPEGVVKVLDFGFAKAAEVAASISPNAGYMSPEQAAAKPVDKRADIWSFGGAATAHVGRASACGGTSVPPVGPSI